MPFTHLHVHTEYSLLDGACRLGGLLDRAVELGMDSLAITDHGNMYGVIDFYRLAREKGVKPIIGCECYVAARTRFDKDKNYDAQRYHLVLLCENETGYKNLMALVSEAWVDGFYTKPRIDRELLEKYHEGLICLSACLAGEIPRALLEGDYEKAKEVALWHENLFGKGNYFIEIQNHHLAEQERVLPQLIRLSQETGIGLVATNDVHYVRQEDHRVQQVLICIQTNHVVGESTGLEFETQEFYLKSEAEMAALFTAAGAGAAGAEAIENTGKIAARCSVEIEFGHTSPPYFEVPGGQDHFEWFRQKCEEGLVRRYGEDPPEAYRERLRYELGIVDSMGYVDYFLIVSDFIAYAKSQGIPVGPARGSGAGSLASYCIGITDIDPMRYNLLFERFLNPERVTMPDFDIDFCCVRRGEVLDYVIAKYGADHVAQIITFNTMAARAALRDVGRALGMAYGVVDKIAKLVPRELRITIEKALQVSPEFKAEYQGDDAVRELVDMAKMVEGMPRNAGTHAAGVVITREPVRAYVPLARNEEAVVTQFTMTTLEELGLLKIDFLSLRTLTEIHDAVEMVRAADPGFDLAKIPDDDAATFELFTKGETSGIFQFEAGWVRNVLMDLKPQSVEDLCTVTSLCRPGPMDSIPACIENRRHPDKIKYLCPQLEPILRVSCGVLLYQEQVMQVFRELAGYSLGRADIVRRIMSKKKHREMEQERDVFLAGCVNNGIAAPVANKLFDEMSSFASYAFNKSHAVSYAFVAYQWAWLKRHYPREFIAALLSNELESSAKVAEYAAECARLGLRLLPPSVNFSGEKFTVEGDSVRFGLLAIKNLGSGFIRQIVAERELRGPFTGFYNFLKRMHDKDFNRRAAESLIKAGALDGLGSEPHGSSNRREMMMALGAFLDELEGDARRNLEGQIGFFDPEMLGMLSAGEQRSAEPRVPSQAEYPHAELLGGEKETLGFYLSGHPLSKMGGLAERLGSAKVSDLLDPENETGQGPHRDNDEVRLLCVIVGVKKKLVKNDATMAFLTVEDLYGQMECLVFPSTLERYANVFAEGRTVLISGRLSLQENKEAKLLCNAIEDMNGEPEQHVGVASKPPAPAQKKNGRRGLFLRFDSGEDPRLPKALQLLDIFDDGALSVMLFYGDTKQYVPHPGVDWNPALAGELARLLGEENVVAKV